MASKHKEGNDCGEFGDFEDFEPTYITAAQLISQFDNEERRRKTIHLFASFAPPVIIAAIIGVMITFSAKSLGPFLLLFAIGFIIGFIVFSNPTINVSSLVLKRFGSVERLAQELNRFYKSEIYKDSKVILSKNGIMTREVFPPEESADFLGFNLYKNIISVFLREVYDNEMVAGRIVQVNQLTGLSAGRIDLLSNNPILVGYALHYYNKWGESQVILYEKKHKQSADEVYKIFRKYCKKAKFGDFDGLEEYIEEHIEEL